MLKINYFKVARKERVSLNEEKYEYLCSKRLAEIKKPRSTNCNM